MMRAPSGLPRSIQLRRPWWPTRVWLYVRLLLLEWEIRSGERWIEDCRRDGITKGAQLRYQLQRVSASVVERAMVQRELGL